MSPKKAKANSHPARILIVDDHPLVRSGLSELISDEPTLEVCGEAAEAGEALQLVNSTKPDLVVVDISLKSGNGIELIKRIKSRQPKIKMLVSSMHDENLYAQRALNAGAMGYVNKQEATEKVVEAILHVLRGEIFLSPAMRERLLHRLVRDPNALNQSPVETLSDRELEVFQQIGTGLTTRQIAKEMHLSAKTIETYREHIKTKLSIDTAAELSRHAVQWVLENG